MNKVLVTGATGLVGRHLCELLASSGHRVVGTTRSTADQSISPNYELRQIGDTGSDIDWTPVLSGVDKVVHLAARVHIMRDQAQDPLAAFRRVNVEGTEQLVRHKGMQNVKRMIYVSTVKVHGDITHDTPFTASDIPSPIGPYAQSKLEAESIVEVLGAELGIESVIVRPPLIYGPGVRGNFLRLMQMIDKRYPLPIGSIHNKRSLVGVANLCDLISECLSNPSAAGKKYLLSDHSDVSTPELVRLIAMSMSRPARLLPVPITMLRLAGKLMGRSSEVLRLTGSLQVDMGETMSSLDWRPPVSIEDGIESAVKWYLNRCADEKF